MSAGILEVRAWTRGCLLLSKAGRILVNNRCGEGQTGLLPASLCRLVVAVQGFSGRPLWIIMRLDGEGGREMQACVVDRGDFYVVLVAKGEEDSDLLVLEGLHVAHVAKLTFAAELKAAAGCDDEAQERQGRSYSVTSEVGTLQEAPSHTRPEFATLQDQFLSPLLNAPTLCRHWLTPLSACGDVVDACLVDSQRSATLLSLPSSRSPAYPSLSPKLWPTLMQHVESLWERMWPPAKSAALFDVRRGDERLLSKRKTPDASRASAWCWCVSRKRGCLPVYVAIRPLPTAALGMHISAVVVVSGKAAREHDEATVGEICEGFQAERRVSEGVWDALDALSEAAASVFPGDIPLSKSKHTEVGHAKPQAPHITGEIPLTKFSSTELEYAKLQVRHTSAPEPPSQPKTSQSIPAPRVRVYRQATFPLPPEDGQNTPSQEQRFIPRPPPARADSPAAALRGSLLTSSVSSLRTGSLSPLPPDLKNPLSISSSQQHIYAEDQAMRSSRMRQDFGLVTPRKEGGFGRGADPDGELNTSAYSLVELYDGTPRKKQPPPQEAIISGCAGDACQEHVTTRFFRAESGEEGEAVMSVGDACASNVGQKSAPTKRACPSLIDVGERRNSHRQGDGEPLTIEALGEGMRVDAEGNRAVLIVKRSEVSPATALSGTLTGMHLQ